MTRLPTGDWWKTGLLGMGSASDVYVASIQLECANQWCYIYGTAPCPVG